MSSPKPKIIHEGSRNFALKKQGIKNQTGKPKDYQPEDAIDV